MMGRRLGQPAQVPWIDRFSEVHQICRRLMVRLPDRVGFVPLRAMSAEAKDGRRHVGIGFVWEKSGLEVGQVFGIGFVPHRVVGLC